MQRLVRYSWCSALIFLGSCSPAPESSPQGGDGGAAGTSALSGAGGQGQAGSAGGFAGAGGSAAGTGGLSDAGTGGSGDTGGTGGAGAGAGNAGNGGGGGSSGSSGGSGGRQYSTDSATFFGEPRCQGIAHCESFESTAEGALPSGFTLQGYGTRTVGTVSDVAARGARSLRFQVPAQGSVTAWLTKTSLGALGDAHFGRVFVRISEPAPSEFVHFDLFAGIGPFMGHTNEVRWAVTGTGAGTSQSNWSFIYNVQPSGDGAGPEFGSEGDRSAHPSVGSFMCLEWSFDAAAAEARFFLDGNAIEYLHIDTERSEIPVFDSLAVGFAKYQNTAAFTVHLDEVAFDPERIGCNN